MDPHPPGKLEREKAYLSTLIEVMPPFIIRKPSIWEGTPAADAMGFSSFSYHVTPITNVSYEYMLNGDSRDSRSWFEFSDWRERLYHDSEFVRKMPPVKLGVDFDESRNSVRKSDYTGLNKPGCCDAVSREHVVPRKSPLDVLRNHFIQPRDSLEELAKTMTDNGMANLAPCVAPTPVGVGIGGKSSKSSPSHRFA